MLRVAGVAAPVVAAAAAHSPPPPSSAQMGGRILYICTRECKWSGYREMQRLLLAGASIDVGDAAGNVALMHAAKRGYVEYVELLLSCGAIADYATALQETALTMAIQEGHLHVVRVLLRYCSEKMFVEEKAWQQLSSQSKMKTYLVFSLLQNHRKSLSLHLCMLTSLCRNTCLRQLRYLKPQDSRDPPSLHLIYPYDSSNESSWSRSQLIFLLDGSQPHPYRQMSTPSLMSSPCDFASSPKRRNRILKSSSLLYLLANRLVVPLFAENPVDRRIWGMTRDIVLRSCSSSAAKSFAIDKSCLVLPVAQTQWSSLDVHRYGTLHDAAEIQSSGRDRTIDNQWDPSNNKDAWLFNQWDPSNEDAWRLLNHKSDAGFEQLKIGHQSAENIFGAVQAHSPQDTRLRPCSRSRIDWEDMFDLNEKKKKKRNKRKDLQQVKKELRGSLALNEY